MEVLANLDTTKTCSPNKILPLVLMSCFGVLSPSLSFVFNRSMLTVMVPSDWKTANVVPIFKKNDWESVKNYRGVALLWTVMGRCHFNLIYSYYIDLLLIPGLHGFCDGHSTDSVPPYIIGHEFDDCNHVNLLYHDILRAFDSVPHDLLCHKICSLGIHGNLLNWFRFYLEGWSQRVVVEVEEESCFCQYPLEYLRAQSLAPFFFLCM